jgi:hypothetical protein
VSPAFRAIRVVADTELHLGLRVIDEFRLDLHPYVAGEGTRLFDDVPKSYRLDLISSTSFRNGIVGLQYRRHR